MDSSDTPTTTLPPSNDRDQLASLLQAFQNEPHLGGQGVGAAAGASYGQVPYVLSDVASPAGLAPLLANKDVQQRLFQHLPPGLDHSEATLRSVIHSPEIRRSLSSLDQALRTGALGPLVQSLGLKQDAALSVENFLQGELFSAYIALPLHAADLGNTRQPSKRRPTATSKAAARAAWI